MNELAQIKQKYQQIPKYVRDAIAAFDVAGVVQEIGKEHRLHIDQTGELAQQINGVLIGDVEREVFLPNIKKKLNIDDETAKEIVREVNDNIFIPIKKDMQNRKDGNNEENEGESPRRAERSSEGTAASVDTKKLAQIEKDKYREPIDNEDIVFDATGVPHNNPQKETSRDNAAEVPAHSPSPKKSVDQERPPEKAQGEVGGNTTSQTEPEKQAINQEGGTEERARPRASMVRNLLDKKDAANRAPKPNIAKQKLQEEEAPDKTSVSPSEWSGEESKPAAESESAPAAEKINRPPTQSGEAKKAEINKDPYREPIE